MTTADGAAGELLPSTLRRRPILSASMEQTRTLFGFVQDEISHAGGSAFPQIRRCGWHGVGYNPTTIFETFPFPAGLTPNVPADSRTSLSGEDSAESAGFMRTGSSSRDGAGTGPGGRVS